MRLRTASGPKTSPKRKVSKEQKERNHERYVQRTYGLVPGEYNERLAAQGGGCAICAKKPRKRYLAVDHDHGTGRVRGLLCYYCNTAIGVFEFDPDTIRRAATYLLDSLVEPSSTEGQV